MEQMVDAGRGVQMVKRVDAGAAVYIYKGYHLRVSFKPATSYDPHCASVRAMVWVPGSNKACHVTNYNDMGSKRALRSAAAWIDSQVG